MSKFTILLLSFILISSLAMNIRNKLDTETDLPVSKSSIYQLISCIMPLLNLIYLQLKFYHQHLPLHELLMLTLVINSLVLKYVHIKVMFDVYVHSTYKAYYVVKILDGSNKELL